MKSRFLFLVIVISMISGIFQVNAFTANEMDASITVTYTIEDVNGGGSTLEPEEQTGAAFEINIPAIISMNELREIHFTADYMNLDDGQMIVIYIDEKSFGDDGDLHLVHTNSMDEMRVSMKRAGIGDVIGNTVIPGDVVASFGNGSLLPSQFGILYLDARTLDVLPGVYTGTIYFNIRVLDT